MTLHKILVFGCWFVFTRATWTWLHCTAAVSACVDVSRSLGCQFFPCLLWLRRQSSGPLTSPDSWHTRGNTDTINYNVLPRLNELHPYSFISHYQVWINYVCGVSDDNEMMMITLTIISISGPQVISNTNSCPTLFWAEQSTKKVRHRVNLSKLGKYVRAHQNIFMQFWTYKEDSFLPYLLKASKHLTILGEVWGALS